MHSLTSFVLNPYKYQRCTRSLHTVVITLRLGVQNKKKPTTMEKDTISGHVASASCRADRAGKHSADGAVD